MQISLEKVFQELKFQTIVNDKKYYPKLILLDEKKNQKKSDHI